jgi:hypothetical protein
MRPITEFLKRFSTLTAPEGVIKDVIQKVVREVLGVSLSKEEIVVMKERVHLRIDSVRRSEIMLGKAEILRKVAEELPGKRVVREIL